MMGSVVVVVMAVPIAGVVTMAMIMMIMRRRRRRIMMIMMMIRWRMIFLDSLMNIHEVYIDLILNTFLCLIVS